MFTIEKRVPDSFGRSGSVATPHGIIETPAFAVVGTKASVKGVTTDQLHAIGTQVVLANTYHLYLQPGDTIVADMGGLHQFMGWSGPTMTDSGGFQVYSLGSALAHDYNKFISKGQLKEFMAGRLPTRAREPLMRINDEGASFRSHIDGSSHLLTPERSIEIQHNIGADIIFVLDECTSPTDSYEYQKKAMDRTHAWAKRSLNMHEHKGKKMKNGQPTQALYGIVQGGWFEDLRRESARTVASMGFDGFGIGGAYTKEDMEDVLRWVNTVLPEHKPRHVLGIGEPTQILAGVAQGADTFDCVAPTREARNGALYTRGGRINLRNARYVSDPKPIEDGCQCPTCQKCSRAYLAHLFRAKDLTAYVLATVHNIFFMNTFMQEIREAIRGGHFADYRKKFEKKYQAPRLT